jgi:hypothetical protein
MAMFPWFKFWNKIDTHWLYKDSRAFHVFCDLLIQINKQKDHRLQQDQCITTHTEIANRTQVERSKVKRVLERMRDDTMLHSKLTRRMTRAGWQTSLLITMVNWEKHQGRDTLFDQEMTRGRGSNKGNKQEVRLKNTYSLTRARGTVEEISAFCVSVGLPASDGEWFFDHCEGNGWINGKSPIRDWRATIRSWKAIHCMASQKARINGNGNGHVRHSRFDPVAATKANIERFKNGA